VGQVQVCGDALEQVHVVYGDGGDVLVKDWSVTAMAVFSGQVCGDALEQVVYGYCCSFSFYGTIHRSS